MKAIAMISGGLDGMLAAKVMSDIGIEIIGLHCSMPFSLRDKSAGRPGGSLLRRFASKTAIDLQVEDISGDFLKMLVKPEFGYGANLNPCIDCKVLMFKKARELMFRRGASFIVSGEVLGQRPMSQQRRTMRIIESKSGLEGMILRPLSAKLLDETVPEKNGWVDRESLHSFSGRSRKPQIDLAVMLGIIEFAQPAGGCLLTDPRFCDRLEDLMKREPLTLNDISLLKLGRHYRIGDKSRLIVGRDKNDNEKIEALALDGDTLFFPPDDIAGPTALARGELAPDQIDVCCRIVSRYCDPCGAPSVGIIYTRKGGGVKEVRVSSAYSDEELLKIRV